MTALPPLAETVAELRNRQVNYDESQAPPFVVTGWHRDRRVADLGHEPPGEPVPGGLAETAVALMERYEFTDPRVVRAVFRPGAVTGRDMLLEGRFLFLRFPVGVRITARWDEVRDGPNGPERVTGWSYQTLHGHLEQGLLAYEVAKDLATGRVEFRIEGYSRRAPVADPVLRLGLRLFGRAMQLRFYRGALARLRALAANPPPPAPPGPDGLARAPGGVTEGRFERFTLRFPHPGR